MFCRFAAPLRFPLLVIFMGLVAGGQHGTPGLTPSLVAARQGARVDGRAVAPERSDPEQALVQDSEMEDRFFSLGLGGSVTVAFDCALTDGPGPELRLFEVTNPNPAYPIERAEVYALVDGDAFRLGAAESQPQDATARVTAQYVDLGAAADAEGQPVRLRQAQRFRIVDVTDPARFRSRPNADGFDLDGVEALQRCPPAL
ncbi:MAG: hypothetical protein R3181_06610 [Rubricoccaceae bacterium]|nr:hypothetical protein [Rubricoccaceae bacterium]